MRKATFAVLLLAASVPLTGCNTKVKPTPANYTATLNAYFVEHPDCLLGGGTRFPYEVGEKLVEVKREPAIHISRYTLTAEGTRLAPRFCFGYRVITSVDNSTPPAPANGFTETQVAYHYKIADVPIWAKSAEITAAFPKFQQETSGHATDKTTLALTGVGWSVPD